MRLELSARHHGTVLFAGLTLAVLSLVGLLTSAAAPADSPPDFGARIPGQRIYDRAGVLTVDELRNLEARAQAVEQAGSPVIVYLQARDASYDATERDARDLMNAWDIQSAPNARDGVVVFFNLKPDDRRHGDVALYAGETLVNGNLPPYELRRIYQDVMRPPLRAGQLAAGIGAGLDTIARDLTVGPPPKPEPSTVEQAAAFVAGWPLNLLAVLATLGLGLVGRRVWAQRPRPRLASPTTTPPDDLPPAMVGALVRGKVSDAQVEATILDLARRDALAIEPAGPKQVQIRLLDARLAASAHERSVWQSLQDRADDSGVVAPKALQKVRSRWSEARAALQTELLSRDWYDPGTPARRRSLYLIALAALVLAVGAFVVTVVGQTIWGLPAIGLLATVSLVAVILGYSYPRTSAAGEEVAAPWRGYLRGLDQARRQPEQAPDLDQAMPYAVALGATGALDKPLKAASARGYAPAWLGRGLAPQPWADGGFYAYWIAFHSGVGASSSSGGGGSGAAAGGAGAVGSF